MKSSGLEKYRREALAELEGDILPFWLKNVVDLGSGGFNGRVDGDGAPDPRADKGAILASRVLWTFSRAHQAIEKAEYLRAADGIYRFIRSHFLDREHGGVYWRVDHKGAPVEKVKKFYAQAFMIYAFTEFARASGDRKPLEEAQTLFDLVEKRGRDRVHGGYFEALGEDWTPVEDIRLSDKDLNTPKSMNTNLHILEAYSNLAQQAPGAPVIEALENLLEVFLEKIIRPDRHFGLFFDNAWNEVSGKTSYGHDIEGSWLLSEAAERIGPGSLRKKIESVSIEMARAALAEGLDAAGGVSNEREADGTPVPGKEWWMQAEGMVGFFNAYERTGEDVFLEKSTGAWEYVKRYFLRPGGEWYAGVRDDGTPDPTRPLAGLWKCPYHNSRACLEIAERIGPGE